MDADLLLPPQSALAIALTPMKPLETLVGLIEPITISFLKGGILILYSIVAVTEEKIHEG